MQKLYKLWISPKTHGQFHLFATGFWCMMIIPTLMWWTASVPFLVFMSLYAIITGHLSSYEAVRAEEITKKQIEGEFDEFEKGEALEDFLVRKKEEC